MNNQGRQFSPPMQDARRPLPDHLQPKGEQVEEGKTELFLEEQPQDEETEQATESLGTIDHDPSPVWSSDADTIERIALKLNSKFDKARIEAGCSLLNSFNFAIQVQAGRTNWRASDYRAFIIALAAMDNIGIEAFEEAKTAQLQTDVENVLSRG